MTKYTAIAILLSLGCASADDPPSSPGAQPEPFAFTPDPELAAQTEKWAARWAAATGLDISVGAGGIPILLNDQLFEATDLCGSDAATYRVGERVRDIIEVDRITSNGCSGWGYVLGHEMGHALGAEHSASGIMSAQLPIGHVYVIDAASLGQVCESARCKAFIPEG